MGKEKKKLDFSFRNNKAAWLLALVLGVSLLGHYSLGREYNKLCRLVIQVEKETGCPQGGRLWQEVVKLSRDRLSSKRMPIEDVK
jgi:hypothetical protein